MIMGIGMDILEIERVKELLERQPRFPERILTESERRTFDALPDGRKQEYFAGRFAAKEAYSKAAGTGIGKELSFLDIEIQVDGNGKPWIVKPISSGVHLSITHSRDYAAAQVIIEK